MLVSAGRLALTVDLEDWIMHVERIDSIQFVPLNNRIAMRAVQLPGTLHKDPADRIIIATARESGCVLVTADERVRNYPHVETVG